MSDSAFKSAPYGAYTVEELKAFIEKNPQLPETVRRMRDELSRREKVAAGDMTVMTDGERLRWSSSLDAMSPREKLRAAIGSVISVWDGWSDETEQRSSEDLQRALKNMERSCYVGMQMEVVLHVSIAFLLMVENGALPREYENLTFDEAIAPLRRMLADGDI